MKNSNLGSEMWKINSSENRREYINLLHKRRQLYMNGAVI